jgi:nucleotide-binding universal stress UspA family protein
MTGSIPNTRFAASVVHPTDLAGSSEPAFAHALAIAVRNKTSLTILHSSAENGRSRRPNFPSVRGLLEKWGRLEQGSPRSAVYDELSVRVKKVSLKSGRPLAAVLDYLKNHPSDLIVVGTQGREGLPRWLQPSVAERIARGVKCMTLFVSSSARGFLSPDNGDVHLHRVLVPIDRDHDLRVAIHHAAGASCMSRTGLVEIILHHVGPEHEIPRTKPPDVLGCRWTVGSSQGSVVDEIVRIAEESSVDLIVMSTKGHESFLDALRGTVTEQVVRRAPCPVLAVPERLHRI